MSKNQMEFITCVIGALALRTGKSGSWIYKKLDSAGLIKEYLAGAYDALHTFSLEYLSEDLINLMEKKGQPLC